MVVGELLVAMRNPMLVQSPHEPAGTIKQIELIILPAIDVRESLDRNPRIVPQPVRPALLDDLAGVERYWQPDPEKLRWIGIVAGGHRQRVDHFAGTFGVLFGR